MSILLLLQVAQALQSSLAELRRRRDDHLARVAADPRAAGGGATMPRLRRVRVALADMLGTGTSTTGRAATALRSSGCAVRASPSLGQMLAR